MSDYYPATNNIPAPPCEHRNRLWQQSSQQAESPAFIIERIRWDSFGIIYICWSGGVCYFWEGGI